MKKNILLFCFVVVLCSLASCSKESLNPVSVFSVDVNEKTEFDKWLDVNYGIPYNIDVKYRYEMNESDFSYYTIPADEDCSIVLAHLVKYLCIDVYDEVAGIKFTRRYFPKMFFYIGEWEYKNNGTFILGTAEGGKKIYLSGVNYIFDVLAGRYGGYTDPREAINHYYIKTIHHEFTHILNQTKDFPADFKQVTPTSYVNDSWSTAPYSNDYLKRGFISAYAQDSDREDFAEMMALFVTHDQAWWDAQLTEAEAAGSSLITNKLDIVKSYMKTTFDIELEDLRSAVLRRQDDVIDGLVDLTSLEIL